ncbi:MAG: nuclear transport factor 2 family protein [Anaerolineae bacterium]|nr:nuclear transport factor 2 family protein [Anaerolineae bacterium]MCB0205886.1 nuclear transport factor 2 family protein [Anaerolineae bacterium]MCB0255795.1 nuclear transport factor 2 family protein [Anaerolineae bacterium]
MDTTMTGQQETPTPSAVLIVQTYLDAFAARDLAACLEHFAQTATILFAGGVYRGREAIEDWHKERFKADLRLLYLEDIRVEGDVVVVEAVATSKRLRLFKIDNLSGLVTLRLDQNQIIEAEFGLRMNNPEYWRL